MNRIIALLLCGITLAGCQSTDDAYSHQMFAKLWYEIDASVSEKIALPHDVVCNLPGGTLLGGNRVTILAGDYTLHARDSGGVFWRHVSRGIVRSGNLGKEEEGGFYRPNDPNGRWLLWLVPKDGAPLPLGPVTMIPKKAEPTLYGVYIGDVPPDAANSLVDAFGSGKPAEPGATDNPDNAQ